MPVGEPIFGQPCPARDSRAPADSRDHRLLEQAIENTFAEIFGRRPTPAGAEG